MGRRKTTRGKRYWFQLTEEEKRRLDHLAVEAGASSSEAYGGELLATIVNQLWDKFDPKRDDKKRKP